MDTFSSIELLIGIFTIAGIIAGSSAFFFKTNINSIKTHTEEWCTRLENSSKQLSKNLYDNIEDNRKSLDIRLDRQQDTISTNLRDLTRHVEKIKDDVHNQEKAFLMLRMDIAERFATKDELNRLEKHVEKITNI